MGKKVKSFSDIFILFVIDAMFLFFLNGNSGSNSSLPNQQESKSNELSQINTTDSLKLRSMDIYIQITKFLKINKSITNKIQSKIPSYLL